MIPIYVSNQSVTTFSIRYITVRQFPTFLETNHLSQLIVIIRVYVARIELNFGFAKVLTGVKLPYFRGRLAARPGYKEPPFLNRESSWTGRPDEC